MPVKVPKLSMSVIKDAIYIIGIVITIFFYFRDKATKQAVIETQIKTTIENQNNILNKLKEIDSKFEKQAELNGKVLMYIDITSGK
jgi:fructose-specific phosphotransferase system component IIB